MILSFDIGGTTIKYGVISNDGEIIEKSYVETIDNKEVLLSSLYDVVDKVMRKYTIEGIGICAPGIIDRNGLMITAGAITSLFGENIKELIEQKYQLPVTIDNDANAVAIAEKWLGNAKNFSNYVCLVLGTGVGGGIVINDQVYSGSHGMAGEFGWNIIANISEEGNLGDASLNDCTAIVSGLCRIYNQKKDFENPSFIPTKNALDIFENEKKGDKIANEVLEKFFTDLSIGIINLISSFDPDAVLIGGGISSNIEFQERLKNRFEEIRHRHENLNQIKIKIDPPIIVAKLKNDAGMLGAAYQVKRII